MTLPKPSADCHQISSSPSPAAGWLRSWPRAAARCTTFELELVDEAPSVPSALDWKVKGSHLTLAEHLLLARGGAALLHLVSGPVRAPDGLRGPQPG